MKFSTKVLVLGTLVSLLGLSVLSFTQYRTTNREVDKTIQSNLELASSQVAEVIHSELQGKRNLAHYLSELLAVTDTYDIPQLLDQSTLGNVFVTSGMGFEHDGAIIHNDKSWTAPSNWDSRTRPWYQAAKSGRGQQITDPYVDEGTGAVLISISQPVYHSDGLLGVSFFDVDLTSIATLISNVKLNHATVFVVDGDGTVIAHPNSKFNGKHISVVTGQGVMSDKTELVDIQGVNYYLGFNKVSGENWLVGMLLPYDEMHSALEEMRNIMLVVFLALLVISSLAYIGMLKILMRPLSELNKAMKNVASGDGDLTKRLNTDTDQEFKELAISFNGFVEVIQELIQGTKQTATYITEYS
ncbi:cache domain-containing sensor histidine kinase, partial [Vibrio genomosp. F10]|uniref:cache domain-containing sensor histidine kinase n=1 Tax=Vibrio genomosp. F10 TaxID=723171 RepID=UPI00114CEEEB